MTDFATWLKKSRPDAGSWLALLGAAALAGCSLPKIGGSDQVSQPPPPKPAPAEPSAAEPPPIPGFTPLPSANQVLAAVSTGRSDPFAPVASPTRSAAGGGPIASAAPPLALPEGFRFSGVVRSGSLAQALVQIGARSGPICAGPGGVCPGSGFETPLLPPGWSVVSIDVDRGRLTLRQGKQSITAEL